MSGSLLRESERVEILAEAIERFRGARSALGMRCSAATLLSYMDAQNALSAAIARVVAADMADARADWKSGAQ